MATKKFLTKEEIYKADDIKIEPFEVEDWGGWICLKTMMASERDAWEANNFLARKKNEIRSMQDFRAKLAIRCICDEHGNFLFTEKDLSLLLFDLFFIIQEMNGLRKADIDKMTENLDQGQSEG